VPHDIRLLFTKMNKMSYSYRDLIQELTSIKKNNKYVPQDMSVFDMYEVCVMLGWFREGGKDKIFVCLT
jgi:hypothetical protein